MFFEGYSFLMIIPDNFMRDPLVDNPPLPKKERRNRGIFGAKKNKGESYLKILNENWLLQSDLESHDFSSE